LRIFASIGPFCLFFICTHMLSPSPGFGKIQAPHLWPFLAEVSFCYHSVFVRWEGAELCMKVAEAAI
jgi:hypothetical protein